MKRIYILSLFALVASLSACDNLETTVNVDLPQHSPKLVVNGLFYNDSTLHFTVSRSRDILSNKGFSFIGSCKIDLYEEQVWKETIRQKKDNGYKSLLTAKAGKNYKIVVTDTIANESVTASTLAPVTLQNIAISNLSKNNEDVRVTLTMRDVQPGIKNYYRMLVKDENGNRNSMYSSDPILSELLPSGAFGDDNNNGEKHFYDWAYFTDDVFDGGTKSFNIHYKDYNTWGNFNYYVEVQVLSFDFYRYAATSLLREQTSGDPFATPVIVYSNINGGFGIFAGVELKRVKVR